MLAIPTWLSLDYSVLPFPLFELKAEAVYAEWKTSLLPSLLERFDQAEKDARAGGIATPLEEHPSKCVMATWLRFGAMATKRSMDNIP
jgi:hypothetical protein